MAPKRPVPSGDPPPADSSEEESSATDDEEEEEKRESGESEAGSGSDTDDEDDKEEQKRPSQPKPSSPPPPPQQKSQGRSGSKTESESESETESESESETPDYTVEPITSRPMEEIQTPPAKKQRPEPPSSSKQPSAKRKVQVEEEQQPSAKRKVEVEESKESKDSKKGKKKDVAENGSLQKPGEESKKPMFHRIWGDDDEVALLRGMIDFREKKGMDPTANTNTFHHYVKKLLGQEFTASQLANKIRVLKKKYSNNEGKGKDGEDRAFSKPHEEKVFQLSKKIWGVNKSNDAGGRGEQTPMPKANGSTKKSKTAGTSSKSKLEALEASQERPKENGGLIPFGNSDAVGMFSCDKMFQLSRIGLDEDFLNKGWEMVDELKKEEFKEKRRKLQLAEMRVLAERAELIQCQSNLILEAYHQATGK